MKNVSVFVLIVIGLALSTLDMLGKRKKEKVDYWPVEVAILQLMAEIRETKDDSLAYRKHREIESLLAETLTQREAYKYKFDSLRFIGRIYAPRKKFCIFNWNQSRRDGTHCHFAFIVVPGRKGEPNKVFRLTDVSDSIKRPDQQLLNANNWFGALYYKIIAKRKGKDKKQYYTLLGLDMNNLKTKKKIIDVLSFAKNGEPQFGGPIIELNGWTKNRVVFEFSARQSMYLEYNCLRRRIEFDHLAPLMPYLVGEYEYYEPDLYRDGLKFRGGMWLHHQDIKVPPTKTVVKKRSLPKPPKIKLPKEVVKIPAEDVKNDEGSVEENVPKEE